MKKMVGMCLVATALGGGGVFYGARTLFAGRAPAAPVGAPAGGPIVDRKPDPGGTKPIATPRRPEAKAAPKIEAVERTAEAPRPDPAPAPGDDRGLTTEEIVAKSEVSVALIRGKNSTGTGFLVRPGVLATNAHVLAEEKVADLQVVFPSAKPAARGPLPCELLYEDAARDLALIAAKTDIAPLALDDGYRFRRGQDITVIGNPSPGAGAAPLENAISRGVMSTTIGDASRTLYQITMAINPGNSGGPVLDPRGRVVGVVVAKAKAAEGLALCVPATDLGSALKGIGPSPQAAKGRALADHDARRMLHLLDRVGVAYLDVLDNYAQAIARAVGGGRSLHDAHRECRAFLDANIGPLERLATQDLYGDLADLGTHPDRGPQVYTDLLDLWSNLLDVRKQLYGAPYRSIDYLARNDILRQIHRKRVDELKVGLRCE